MNITETTLFAIIVLGFAGGERGCRLSADVGYPSFATAVFAPRAGALAGA
jgi:hypothetical protein